MENLIRNLSNDTETVLVPFANVVPLDVAIELEKLIGRCIYMVRVIIHPTIPLLNCITLRRPIVHLPSITRIEYPRHSHEPSKYHASIIHTHYRHRQSPRHRKQNQLKRNPNHSKHINNIPNAIAQIPVCCIDLSAAVKQ
jgi:hypothetical protein